MPEIIRPDSPHDIAWMERALLRNCLKERRPDAKPFANGAIANNHIDAAFQEVPENLRRPIAVQAAKLIIKSGVRPVFIAGVPEGALGWAELVADTLAGEGYDRPEALAFTKEDRRKFSTSLETKDKIDELRILYGLHPEGVVMDDATTDGGTTAVFADHATEEGLVVRLALSLFFRSKLTTLRSKYTRAVVFNREIPYEMDWEEYRRSGLIVPNAKSD